MSLRKGVPPPVPRFTASTPRSFSTSVSAPVKSGVRRRRDKVGKALYYIAGLGVTSAAAGSVWAFLREHHMLPSEYYEWEHSIDWQELMLCATMANMTSRSAEYLDAWFRKETPLVPDTDWQRAADGLATVSRDLPSVHSKYFVFAGRTQDGRKVRIVCIRGSVAKENWRVNFRSSKVWDPITGCAIHRGFLQVANLLLLDLLENGLLDKDSEIKLVGHSQGGAVAVILAMMLSTMNYRISGVMTFGAPKVTDKEGAEKFKDLPILRVTNENDIVPVLGLPGVGKKRTPNESGTTLRSMKSMGGVSAGVGGYEHLGSQLVLLRPRKRVCMECARKEGKRALRGELGDSDVTVMPSPPPSQIPLHLDDAFDFSVLSDDYPYTNQGEKDVSETNSNKGPVVPACPHGLIEGGSYFQPQGGMRGFFDSLPMRFSIRNFQHRMHYYEESIKCRLEEDIKRRSRAEEDMIHKGGTPVPPLGI